MVKTKRDGKLAGCDSYRALGMGLLSFTNLKPKPVIYTVVALVIAVWVLRLLQTGGWLTHHYEWNDPNTINFVLMLVEPLVILGVIAYWIWRTAGLYRVLFISFVLQLVVAAGFVAFFSFFFFTWKPKLM
jgi:hypothetical protein